MEKDDALGLRGEMRKAGKTGKTCGTGFSCSRTGVTYLCEKVPGSAARPEPSRRSLCCRGLVVDAA